MFSILLIFVLFSSIWGSHLVALRALCSEIISGGAERYCVVLCQGLNLGHPNARQVPQTLSHFLRTSGILSFKCPALSPLPPQTHFWAPIGTSSHLFPALLGSLSLYIPPTPTLPEAFSPHSPLLTWSHCLHPQDPQSWGSNPAQPIKSPFRKMSQAPALSGYWRCCPKTPRPQGLGKQECPSTLLPSYHACCINAL